MKHIALFLVLFVATCTCSASETLSCQGQIYSLVHSLNDLPTPVAVLLGKGISGQLGIADSGQPYQETDVIMNDSLPWRRFRMAAVSANDVRAVVDHGGRGWHMDIWIFHRREDGWHGAQQGWTVQMKDNLAFLLAGQC